MKEKFLQYCDSKIKKINGYSHELGNVYHKLSLNMCKSIKPSLRDATQQLIIFVRQF